MTDLLSGGGYVRVLIDGRWSDSLIPFSTFQGGNRNGMLAYFIISST